MRRSGVRSSSSPPFTKIPTLIGWDFFCPFPQCWSGFGLWPRERQPLTRPCLGVFLASLSLFFSASLVSVHCPTSNNDAGLRVIGLIWPLLSRSRTEIGECASAGSCVTAKAGCLPATADWAGHTRLEDARRLCVGRAGNYENFDDRWATWLPSASAAHQDGLVAHVCLPVESSSLAESDRISRG